MSEPRTSIDDLLRDAQVLAETIRNWGLQTETYELDLTSPEFGQVFRFATNLLEKMKGQP